MSHQSPSPSPSPAGQNGTSAATKSARQSLGPAARAPAGLSPLSPRPSASAARPTSELLGAGSFQNPEVEALDQWFENLATYEATLEEMAAASLDVNFKEELSAIEQWFRVLSEAERTAALYSLLQHSTQVQIRFFITVLQQMARSDPMTALLSPSGGGSMQAQMEAKLASMNLKSPGIKAPPSPSGRNFSGSYLAPEGLPASPNPEAAATLAQQRARLKASNADAASRRISAPGTLSNAGDGRNVWQSPQLDQVAEREPSPAPQEQPSPGPASARPKSTDFSVLTSAFKNRPSGSTVGQDVLSPIGNWSSNVNTPLIPMFGNQTEPPNLDGAVSKLSSWSTAKTPNNTNGRINLADAKSFRRPSKASNAGDSGNVYGDDGNLIGSSPQPSARSTSGNLRAQSNAGGGGSGWGGSGVRSPASNVSSNRFGNNINQEELLAAAAAGGMPFNFAGLGMNPMMAGLGGMGGLPGLNMNMMGMVDPVQANYLAAQIAAGQMGGGMGGIPGMGMPGMAGMAGMGYGMQNGMNNRNARPPNRTNNKSSLNGREPAQLSEEDEMKKLDALLADVPAWLRSLRLHKYTPNFQGMKWTDMVDLNEQQLEDKGVAALGARRKLLKTFEEVKAKKGMA